MNIAVIGTGYVGLVQAVGLAQLGHHVAGLDVDEQKIAKLSRGQSPIYEPGLERLLQKNLKKGNLKFTTNRSDALADTGIIFIAVGTPSKKDGSVDLIFVKQAAKTIGETLKKSLKFRLVVNKSTVPIGTGDIVYQMIRQYCNGPLEVVSNPEFLREGQAVADFFHPDRIIIGNGSPKVGKIMKSLYRGLKAPTLHTDAKTAELIKYASNAFLATSISFINQLSWLADAVGADVSKVAEGMKLDKRIGKRAFLTAGPGYGGSCFPKDVAGILSIAKKYGVKLPIIDAADKVNRRQKQRIFDKITAALGSLENKTIVVWGLSFKAMTDDIRESPALDIIQKLLDAGARVAAFDPAAEANAAKIFPSVKFFGDPIGALQNADGLVIMTDWPAFANVKPSQIKKTMKTPVVVDARNVFDRQKMFEAGIQYTGVGR